MRTTDAVWWMLLVTLAAGGVLVAAGLTAAGIPLLVVTGFVAALRAARRRSSLAALDVALGAGLLLVLAALPAELPVRIAVGAGALQVILAAAALRPGGARHWARLVLPLSGHAAILAGGIALVVPGGHGADGAWLAYAGGFSILLLHARWAREDASSWDAVLLWSLVTSTLAVAWHYVAGTGLLTGMAPTRPGALLVAYLAGLLALAAVARPPALPWPAPRGGSSSVATALAHGGAALAIVNVLFVVLSLFAIASARLLVAAITLYILFGVAMEYRAVRRARSARTLFEAPAPEIGALPPITVVVAARNEADALPASLQENLHLPASCQFLLVPSAASDDGTVELCHDLAARDPARIRVLPGVGGSKAADLNAAWATIETDLVLMLDADETVSEESLRWAVAKLADEPDVALVQGRKVSRAPEVSALSRFITTERRHATGLDQMMHAQLGSTHFAGSAALLRRRIVDELGGWTERTLTEDIEFTLRLHLGSDSRIAYEPRLLVHESDPESLRALVEQRTRWARGWAQCFALFFGEVFARRAQLGRVRAFGLAWLLVIAVSAPIMALVPAFLLMRAVGIPSLLPYAIGVAIAAFILPARLVGYGYSALHDPHIPVARRPGRIAESLLFAYAWIVVGWIFGLHALYLELSSAPRVWHVTRKRTAAPVRVPVRGRGARA